MIAALVALTLPDSVQAQAQQGANLSGIYWCDPQPSPCPWPGQAMSITQSGISLSSDKASYVGDGLPWDVMRTIISDRSIKWPDGAGNANRPE